MSLDPPLSLNFLRGRSSSDALARHKARGSWDVGDALERFHARWVAARGAR